jgi:hypothetical protein
MDWSTTIEALKAASVVFDQGLSDEEIAGVEATFGFRFPPDLRAFLATALPVSGRFPDWRNGDEDELRERLSDPLEGILFDVEFNGFWQPAWPERPDDLEAAKDIVRSLVADAPRLIPVYSHRMMPDRPHEAGNPVFSVHQTDIIYYGFDLQDYLEHEFEIGERRPWPDEVREIPFWDIESFLEVRWAEGSCVFDNRKGILPTGEE